MSEQSFESFENSEIVQIESEALLEENSEEAITGDFTGADRHALLDLLEAEEAPTELTYDEYEQRYFKIALEIEARRHANDITGFNAAESELTQLQTDNPEFAETYFEKFKNHKAWSSKR